MTEITKTRDELVTQASEELMLIASGQELEGEDQQKIDSRVDGLFAELSARKVCEVTDDQAIPIEWVDPLAILLANASATVFGKPRMADQLREMVEDRLRIMVENGQASNRYLRVENAVLPALSGYSVARWRSGT